MTRNRIIVDVVPEILHEILCDVLVSEPGFDVRCVTNGNVYAALSVDWPLDTVVTMIDEGVTPTYQQLFRVNPSIRLLGLKARGRDAFLIELQPKRVFLGELSSDDLVDAIRTAAARPDFVAHLAMI